MGGPSAPGMDRAPGELTMQLDRARATVSNLEECLIELANLVNRLAASAKEPVRDPRVPPQQIIEGSFQGRMREFNDRFALALATLDSLTKRLDEII